MFFEFFFKAFEDLRDIGGARIAAVGSSTAARVRGLRLKVDVVPSKFESRHIARALADFESLENLRMLLPRAEVASRELPALLEEKGAIVDDIGFYRTVPETDMPPGALQQLETNGADWLTFTSGSTVDYFHARFDLPRLLKGFPKIKTAVICPETARHVRELGIQPNAEADPHTLDGLVDALLRSRAAPPPSGAKPS
jgi:uroporphyrinogen III methyltransferase/synthase